MTQEELIDRLKRHEEFVEFLTETVTLWRRLNGGWASWHEYELTSFRECTNLERAYIQDTSFGRGAGLYVEFEIDEDEHDSEVIPYQFVIADRSEQMAAVEEFERAVKEKYDQRQAELSALAEYRERAELQRLLEKYHGDEMT